MKRFHVHVSVSDLAKSVTFYNTLFGQAPSVQKENYAKWMLEDPRLNFAISERAANLGVEHVGFQADTREELDALTQRLKAADVAVQDEIGTTCCYANSDKGWIHDPDNLAWESFYTFGDATTYSAPDEVTSAAACCTPQAPATVSLGMPSSAKKAQGACCA
jgi:catechol 2,3-dioxygenase-like lactoylglutathione lyase family enzyme